ncbi:MAG TPA: oxygen-independent coproporphyrinogen III oxidase [Gammaproteobacteria bacterium]|nr:oxygen-independent coproporphyrinogen III oxidase [Gammaproteobacteria bacterium]
MDIEGFDPELVRRYDVSGPRYTSYPTARQFTTAIDEAAYRSAVTRSNEDFIPSALSLYLHLPFCSSPCFYCGCSRLITCRPEVIAAYLERLHREVALQGQCFDRDRPVRQLHFGGGTPTYLTDTQLSELFAALRTAFSFATSGPVEFAIEVDPRSVDAARIARLAALGFNRVSYGFQDFDPAVQQAVNRIQDPGHCLGLIGAARAAGFRSVSVDLIYGLPCQTEAGFAKTLRSVAAARPDRVAVYGYAHMPSQFKAQRLIRNEDLPDANLRLRLLTQAVRELTAAGYLYIGMDHFSLPDDDLVRARNAGTLQRNFQGYSTLAGLDLVGVGLTAIGHVGDLYAQNAKALNDYYAALDAGRLAVQRGYRLSADDRARADVIGRLMCYDELRFADIERAHDLEFTRYFAPELERLAPLAADGLVRTGEDGIAVLPRGCYLRRALAMVFDAYRPRETAANSYSRVI